MKFISTLAFLGLSSLVHAQCPNGACLSSISAIPTCGATCLSSAGSAVGCTATTDLDCQCTSSAQIQASAIDCVVSSCGFLAALAVQASASAVCACNTASPPAPSPCSASATPTPVITAPPSKRAIRGALQARASCPDARCISSESAIPSCGQSCLISAGSAVGCSGTTDLNCQCSKSASIQASALNCVVSDCGLATALQVQASAQAVCSCNSANPYTAC